MGVGQHAWPPCAWGVLSWSPQLRLLGFVLTPDFGYHGSDLCLHDHFLDPHDRYLTPDRTLDHAHCLLDLDHDRTRMRLHALQCALRWAIQDGILRQGLLQ